jgi:two-component system, NarL family, response regulator NreC
MTAMITIVLAEDHHIVRQGLRSMMAAEKQFRLLGEAADGLAAMELVAKHKPGILVLSMNSEEPYVAEALRSGALGYVLKDCATSNLSEAIRAVATGKRYLSPALAERAIDALFQEPGRLGLDPYDTLTERERLVLQLAAEGFGNPEVAAKLFISPRTAESHRANLMRKLSLRSQTDLVRYAIRKKIIAA